MKRKIKNLINRLIYITIYIPDAWIHTIGDESINFQSDISGYIVKINRWTGKHVATPALNLRSGYNCRHHFEPVTSLDERKAK